LHDLELPSSGNKLTERHYKVVSIQSEYQFVRFINIG